MIKWQSDILRFMNDKITVMFHRQNVPEIFHSFRKYHVWKLWFLENILHITIAWQSNEIVKNNLILRMTPENRRKTFHNWSKA